MESQYWKQAEGGSESDTTDTALESWDSFSNLWQTSGTEHYDWIKEGNGIITMWSKDSDNVFPYIWWYIGFDKNRGLFESSSWMITGDFYYDETGVVKVETCNWNGFNLKRPDRTSCSSNVRVQQ